MGSQSQTGLSDFHFQFHFISLACEIQHTYIHTYIYIYIILYMCMQTHTHIYIYIYNLQFWVVSFQSLGIVHIKTDFPSCLPFKSMLSQNHTVEHEQDKEFK